MTLSPPIEAHKATLAGERPLEPHVQAALDRAIARYETMTGRPFRDPEPTEAEIAAARKRADAAVRRLIGGLL